MKMKASAPQRCGRAATMCALLAVLAFGVSACGRPHVKGTVAVDSILKQWTSDGFDTGAVVNIEPETWSAGACSRGMVNDLDVLLCEYAADESLKAGEQKMLSDWDAEGIPTGAVVRTSRTLLAIADRNKVDPSGRTIQRLINGFREQR